MFVEIGADPRKFFASLGKLNKAMGQIGKNIGSVGTRMSGIGVGMAAPIGLAVRQFAAFDDAIRATAAVSQASGRELQMLNDKARELGATTSFTAIDVANLMTELGRAGFRPDEINAMTGAVLDLARATGTDAALSAGIMAATLRQFGLGATEATRAADVLTKAANSTFNTVTSLGESLKYAGPVAKSLGMSLEDTTAILGVLGNVGIQGSEAGTALRRLSVISAGAGDELKKLFGVTNTDAAGNLKPLVDILDEINKATMNMPVAERTAKMAEAFGLLGITSANVLSSSAEGVRGLAESLRNAEGTAAKAAKEMDAGLGGAFRIALSAIEGTALAIGDALAPALINLINGITDVATGLTAFVKANQELVLSVAKGIALFTAVGGTLIGLGSALQLASFSLGGLLSAFSGIAAVVGVVLSPLGLLIAGLAALVAFGPQISSAMRGMFGGVGAMIEAASSAIGGGFTAAVQNGAVVLGDLAGIATTTFDGIYAAIAEGDLAGAMDVLWLGLQAGWLRGVEAFMSVVDQFTTAFQDVFGRIGSEIYLIWDQLYTNSAAVLNTMGAWIMGFFDNIANGVMATFDNLVAAIQIAWTRVQGFITGAKDTKERVQEIRDENAARAEQRRQQRPGIDARMEQAAQQNADAELQRKDRERAVVEGEAANRESRQQENQRRADERRAATQQAESRVGVASRGKREARAKNDQFARLMKDMEGASSMEQLRSFYEEFDALNSNGRLTSAQASTLEAALEDAQERVQKNMVHQQSASAAAQAAAQGGANAAAQDSARSKAEVAGTFSAQAAAGMGFGSSLAERTAKAVEETAKNTGRIADEGMGGRVAA